MNWEIAKEVALLLSATIATLTFVLKFRSDSEARRKSGVLSWQRTVVHSLFQGVETDVLKFQEILQRYRTEAFAFGKHTLKKDELTEDALREILITLVDFGCLLQLGKDTYKLKQNREFEREFAPVMANAMQSLTSYQPQLQQLLTQQLVVTDQVLNLVAEHPNRYSISDVVLKLSSTGQIPQERASAIVRRLISVRALEESEEGKLSLGKNKDLATALGPI